MRKLNRLFLAITLIVAMLFTGCSAVIDEEDDGNGVIVSESEITESSKQSETTVEAATETTTEAATEATEETTIETTAESTTEATTEVATEATETVVEETTEETTEATTETIIESEETKVTTLDKDGTYTTKEDVALYIYTYGELPSNFITKKEAKALGWSSGSLEPYAPGKCIGGDYFGNYEGVLPEGKYHECDIDTLGAKSRGAKRIVFSDDGRIYYTEDHYETFTLLYGEES